MLHNLARALFGRLLVLWNPSIFSIIPLMVHKQFIHSFTTHLPSNQSFQLTSIYAENNKDHRQLILDIIPLLKPANSPWICFGDWNCMQLSTNRLGGNPLTFQATTPLNNAIFSADLFLISESGC